MRPARPRIATLHVRQPHPLPRGPLGLAMLLAVITMLAGGNLLGAAAQAGHPPATILAR